ncbi:PAS domain-containing sensor histidine kinase [Azohydromonas australica]|uniref:PAS domain-containing sensor histidine kinase n=1 Tax=Azohydromonas australica TaxID=364039 RepID=UPI00040F2796|nr:PAS domain S-box protein [Azohydromonas australica]
MASAFDDNPGYATKPRIGLRAEGDRTTLLHEQGFWAAMAASAQDAIVGCTTDGIVNFWNPAAQRLLGWSVGEAVGRSFNQLTLPPSKAQEARRLQRWVQEGRDVPPFHTQRMDCHGTALDLLISVSPIRNDQGHVTGAVTTMRDVRVVHKALRHESQPGTAASSRAREEPVAALSAILNSAASAIITADLQGHITSFNPAAEAMFRMAESQALGRLITEISYRKEAAEPVNVHPGQKAMDTCTLGIGTASDDQRGERTYVRADGTCFPGLLSISMLRETAGRVLGILCIITDLTERKQMEQALRERTLQAEAASRAKSAFLAHMSHEIRTPLNAVIGLSQLLERMELPDKAHAFVGHISQAGSQLLGLTDDVLDLSRIEAADMQLKRTSFELLALLQSVQDIAEPQALEKGLTLRLEVDANLPVKLLGDVVRLRQILLNLLGNAVKFTRAGSVTLRVAELQRQASRSLLRFEVADTGIGIAPEHQERIFEPFTQAESYTTRRFGGSGLGLSIVHRLVTMMEGTLDVESVLDRGSIFTATLSLDMTQ